MMKQPDQKVGKVFLIFVGICAVALPLIVFLAISFDTEEAETSVLETRNMDFDDTGKVIFDSYDRISKDYLEGTSSERTLSEYYSRRQYPGSPPVIPHKVEEADVAQIECLSCHAKGGWTEELRRHTPITPHPEQVACRQCHVTSGESRLFIGNNFKSIAPPRLGRADLPGAPPPIPHGLQMRGNCVACHVGPGTVTVIRVEHPSRGNCRQCHVKETDAEPFIRKPKPDQSRLK